MDAYASIMKNREHEATSSVVLLPLQQSSSSDSTMLGITKSSNSNRRTRTYGSLGTLDTETYITSSSSSSQESSTDTDDNMNGNNDNKYHNHLSIDLASTDNSGDSSSDVENGILSGSGGHSRDSSYSDISSDGGGGGYYDRFARYNRRSDDGTTPCSFIETYLLTRHNFKVIVSGVLWFISYMIMGVFGGSVAYLHFERRGSSVPDPLPDFGYDVIPYYCPHVPHVPHSNVQSVVLFILYAIIISGVVLRWKPRYHPKSGTVIWGGDGRLILQHLCHLNCLVFLTRTTTVGLTGLPQPNPKCVEQQHLEVTFSNALIFVMGRGFPPHACGDLIYSGHVGCTLICMAVLHRHGFLKNRIAAISTWVVAVIGIYFTISCRSHYSVDVMLAFYFGYFLPEWYFNRSDGRVRGKVSRWIRKMEVRPSDLSLIDYDGDNKGDVEGVYPSTISV